MVAKTSWHRYGTKLYITVTLCVQCIFSHWKRPAQKTSTVPVVSAQFRCLLALRVGCGSDMELGHSVTGSMGHLGHLSRPGHRVIILTRCETRVFPVFEKMPKMQNVLWNAEIIKVIVKCLLLDWNHRISVHAMNCYFYLWLLKNLCPENTSSHISRHLEFTIEQGHRVNWVSGSLDSRVTKCDPVPSLVQRP